MRKIFICLLTLFIFTGTAVYAGPGQPGHSHGPATPITEAQALEKATSVVQSLVKKEKIDISWSEVRPTGVEKKQFEVGTAWVITFNNPKVEEKAKQTLYIFLSLSGEYIAANYSGK